MVRSAPSERPSLEIQIAGAGISPRDIPIGELAKLLTATSGVLRAIADERKIAAVDIALVELRSGSVVLKLEASDPDTDPTFATLAESTHEAVRLRGQDSSAATRVALEKLYDACRRGPLQITG